MDEVKQTMMVVGIKAVADDVMEIELMQLLHKQKKVSMFQLAKMDAVEAAELIKGTAYHRDKIHLPRIWCTENNIIPFSIIKISIERPLPEETNNITKEFR